MWREVALLKSGISTRLCKFLGRQATHLGVNRRVISLIWRCSILVMVIAPFGGTWLDEMRP